jgi:Na+-translocating ferredoxin:NAD+ oxidoreductase RNF subunit RnfB
LKDSPLVRPSFYDSALEAVDLTDQAVGLLDYPQNLFIPVLVRAEEAINSLIRKESTKGEAALTVALAQYTFELGICVTVKRCSTEALKVKSRNAIRVIKSATLAPDTPVAPCSAPVPAAVPEVKPKPPTKPKHS